MNPIKALARRLAFLALLGASIGLMLIGKLETVLVEEVRTTVTDAAAPVLDFISRPVAVFAHYARSLHGLAELRSENGRLRAENERLRRWKLLAHRLEGENEALRELLRFDRDRGRRHRRCSPARLRRRTWPRWWICPCRWNRSARE